MWSLVAAEEGPPAQDVVVGPMAGLEVTLSAGVVPAAAGGGTEIHFKTRDCCQGISLMRHCVSCLQNELFTS